ncbi:2-C-methyl-D-erythritol 2,4-cyclodiphosphate synthase [Cryobacterium melibiosiphilum]|uniref:Bifunctional enzyme IspD/IspF n=1 Tax=Cryobacterium melibiosiphilum TaxID=995039 RepID=A0A3A5MM91_9MICO|nr:2-C-methyl-D-erythritol 4-phosphate cytidylyltransferase [Cryobacterium melibiosiphilum]RJT86162.1 2-C-methyl-D-erythritol 2,4-cyclodiphosphate synthase [Cryobacterium melibiosiphilum]
MTDSPAPLVAVIVVAAGSGTRLAAGQPKAFVPLQGQPMLAHALRGVTGMREPAQIILVVPADRVVEARQIAAGVNIRAEADPSVSAPVSALDLEVVVGGSSRQESVQRGLARLHPSVEIVLVHDAARALTPSALADAVVDAVRATGHGVIPGLAVSDTIKRVAETAADASQLGTVLGTVDRSELAAVQTPQGFPRHVLIAAVAAASPEMTDDAAIVAAAGHPVRVIAGHPLAFKITTRADLDRAEHLLAAARTPRSSPVFDATPRIGTGLDVHAFDDASPLWLAGLHWPGEQGLSGHSDGDAAVHAICDALLSAAGLGDIGTIFGTDDPRLVDAHGDVFLRETLALVHAAGFRVGNVSVQIIGNRPKLSPRRAEAQSLLSGILDAPVNVSATTTDALGFTGRGEGVAALASAVLVPRDVALPAGSGPGRANDLNLGL